MERNIENLKKTADQLRLDVVKMVHDAGDGHPGPAMSALDIITSLFFHELNVDAKNPKWEDRDRFILSKGHACPGLYAALARKGYFSVNEFAGLRTLGSILQGHPTMQKTPGIDMTSGSLGNGLPIGTGMAIAAKYNKKNYYTYVILGDGEIQEGIVWEAAMCAKRYRLDNLIAFIDHNGWQSGGSVEEVSGLLPIKEKWEAFGWYVQEIDGHDYHQILDAIDHAKKQKGKPSMIVARTIKGKGIDYMENDNSWHKRVPDDAQLARAIELLGGEA
ncbi:MAG TPA: transketolase [Firmicutes bacterium]|jgi:transketolase|nr:transketolase [Bacillota bacterium]